MDIELLKKVAKKTRVNFCPPTQIEGYEDEEVKKAVSELIANKVIICGKGDEYLPIIGSSNRVRKSEETRDLAQVFPKQFEKIYGEKLD